MIIVEEKRPPTPPPMATEDPWADWKPTWDSQTPHRQQERHSPTQQVQLRLTAERQEQRAQRRMVDARLWDAMTPIQQDAACLIATSFEMMGRGMGYVASNWQRIPGCKSAANVSAAHAHMINFYIEWSQKCARQKISHAMIVDVLCFGFSCRDIDRDRRLRTGSTRGNLMAGLSLYCVLRGWGK